MSKTKGRSVVHAKHYYYYNDVGLQINEWVKNTIVEPNIFDNRFAKN